MSSSAGVSAASHPLTRGCISCHKTIEELGEQAGAIQRCAHCHLVFYCSPECKKLEERVHMYDLSIKNLLYSRMTTYMASIGREDKLGMMDAREAVDERQKVMKVVRTSHLQSELQTNPGSLQEAIDEIFEMGKRENLIYPAIFTYIVKCLVDLELFEAARAYAKSTIYTAELLPLIKKKESELASF